MIATDIMRLELQEGEERRGVSGEMGPPPVFNLK